MCVYLCVYGGVSEETSLKFLYEVVVEGYHFKVV